ncbi:hypothetical protein [Brevibacillus agri]|uniref:hypothetical protein n=1 Tax=Brevibacillus agri TaxID=51101 RepID=UPI0025B6B637|nr:hypothetical protein [Brevibacillus agri]MDN4093648.1 hypothetical protein [Brevibacillus agri]MED3499050.1 hypothetical protein [Brevibacillus agri]
MTYTNNNNNNQMQSQQQQQFLGAMSPAGAMFQPGFAGTNVQEVQHWNHGGHAQSIGTPTYGMASGGGASGAQSIFSPGFAGTNAQEVRQQNHSYQAPQQQGYGQQQAYGQQQQQQAYVPNQAFNAIMHQSGNYAQTQPSYNQGYGAGAGSIFSPGFAGTNAQEVRQQNQQGYTGYQGFAGQQQPYTAQVAYPPALTGSIFSPGFAHTNVQEVRQQNHGGGYAASLPQGGFGMQAQYGQQQQQQAQQYQQPLGSGAHSIFSPGFAGTNVQEVRQLNTPGQAAPHTGSIFPGSF